MEMDTCGGEGERKRGLVSPRSHVSSAYSGQQQHWMALMVHRYTGMYVEDEVPPILHPMEGQDATLSNIKEKKRYICRWSIHPPTCCSSSHMQTPWMSVQHVAAMKGRYTSKCLFFIPPPNDSEVN